MDEKPTSALEDAREYLRDAKERAIARGVYPDANDLRRMEFAVRDARSTEEVERIIRAVSSEQDTPAKILAGIDARNGRSTDGSAT